MGAINGILMGVYAVVIAFHSKKENKSEKTQYSAVLRK